MQQHCWCHRVSSCSVQGVLHPGDHGLLGPTGADCLQPPSARPALPSQPATEELLGSCRYQVQAYFSGHEHDLQWHHLDGEATHYIVSGAGSLTDYPDTYYPSARSRFLHQGSGEFLPCTHPSSASALGMACSAADADKAAAVRLQVLVANPLGQESWVPVPN